MFHELAFLACTFFVTGAICLGGALYRVPQYNDQEVWSELEFQRHYAAAGFSKLAKIEQDAGETRGYLEHKIGGLDQKYQAVADDFYRHLSLNAKKKQVHR